MSKKIEIQRLVNMQSLLNEYERENKSLNQQIIDLLAQNKALKIQKINTEALQQSDKYAKKHNGSLGRSNKKDENLIDKMWKLKQEEINRQISKKKQVKDEGVQVEIIKENQISKQTFPKEQKGHKLLGSDTFSFGQNTIRQQLQGKVIVQKHDKACSPPKFIERVEKEDNKNINQNDLSSKLSDMTPINQYMSSSRNIVVEEKPEQKLLPPTKRIKKRIEEGSEKDEIRKNNSHAILPSPNLLSVSNSQSRLSVANRNSKEKTYLSRIKRQASAEKVAVASGQKKKNFIQVMSSQLSQGTRTNHFCFS